MLAGCSQAKYRMAADKEVKYLVDQKSNDPRWDLPNFTIGMDPRSRYFDPTDPDGAPMPYDDPAAHRYMHCIDGKKGYPCWHMYGDWYKLEAAAHAIQRSDPGRGRQADDERLGVSGQSTLGPLP